MDKRNMLKYTGNGATDMQDMPLAYKQRVIDIILSRIVDRQHVMYAYYKRCTDSNRYVNHIDVYKAQQEEALAIIGILEIESCAQRRNMLGDANDNETFMRLSKQEISGEDVRSEMLYFDGIPEYRDCEPSGEDLAILERVLKYASQCKYMGFTGADARLVIGCTTMKDIADEDVRSEMLYFDMIWEYPDDEAPSREDLATVESVLKYASQCKYMGFTGADARLVMSCTTNVLMWALGCREPEVE